MRILMSIALAMACSVGVSAADQSGGGGIGGSSSSAAQHPINSVDPVTGKNVDPSLPAVLVPNPASLTPNGTAGDRGAASGGMGGGVGQAGGASQDMVAIGISERSSAEIIRANPQLYLPAARANKRFDQVGGQSSGSMPGSWQPDSDTSGSPSTGLDNAGAGAGDTGNTRSDSTVEQGSGYPDAGASSGVGAGDPNAGSSLGTRPDGSLDSSGSAQDSSFGGSGASGSSPGMQPDAGDGSSGVQPGSSQDSSSGLQPDADMNSGSGIDSVSPSNGASSGEVDVHTSPDIDPLDQNTGAGADMGSDVQSGDQP